MNHKCENEKKDCGDLCGETHKQLLPLMLVFGGILVSMVVYAYATGAFSKLLSS